MSLYDEPVWKLMHQMVDTLHIKEGDTVKKDDVIKWFKENYPKIKKSTISAHLIRLSTNAPSRVHYNAKPGDDDLFYQIDSDTFRLYVSKKDPSPIYKTNKESSPFATAIKAIQDYESEKNAELDHLKMLVTQLEDENQKLRNELAVRDQSSNNVNDASLKDRISGLSSAHSDTIIREAGVVLEDRLRVIGKVDSSLHGANLVDSVLSPDKGVLIFSSHSGEQDGVRMLYRGAMQFIRNPPMHKLMDYSDSVSRLLLHLIDTLLQLLTELNPRHIDEITVDDVRAVLKRAKITRLQKSLFQTLSNYGNKWVSASDLAADMGIDKAKLSGVLGALGRRINSTKGLEDKGGILLLLDIDDIDDEWHYRMKQVLLNALKMENII